MTDHSLDWWRPDVVAFAPAVEIDVPVEHAGGRLAFGALMAFTFILVIAPQEFVPPLAAVRPALLAAVVASAAYALDRSRRLGSGRPSREVVIAAALFAWAAATIPLSIWPGGSASILADLFGKALIVFWLLGAVVDRVDRLRALMWMLAVLSVALALTGLRHYASGEFLADAAAGRIQGYPSGLAGNPNDLALTLDIIVPLTMALLLCAQRVFDRVVLLGILGLNVAAIVTTFSRGGFVTLATMAVVAVPWIVRRWGAAPLAALAVTALLASTLLPSSYLDRLQTIGDIESDPTGSAQDRWRDTVAAVRLVGEHPVVGSGLGMDFLALNDARGRTWKSVHNAYLNYGVDLGLPGLGLFVALLASAIWSARRIERRPPPFDGGAELATLAGGVRIALVGFAVGAVFYPVAYHLYFYYLAGLAVSLQTIAHHEAAVRV